MATYTVILVDRQTKKKEFVKIEAKSPREAKMIAIEKFGVAYEVK